MGGRPDLQLLANGDILVPVKEDGAWRVQRVVPDDAEYASWLEAVQRGNREPGLLARGVSFWLAGVLVFFGFVLFLMILSLLLTHAL
jgi:hypothetical protein